MSFPRPPSRSRREMLGRLGAAAGAGLLGLDARPTAAEPPPESRTIRLALDPAQPVLCWAPKYLMRELLLMEGFEDVRFVPYGDPPTDAHLLASGAADIAADLVTGFIPPIDRDWPVVVLAGMHPGCTEVFASERVGSIGELRGKRVASFAPGSSTQVFVSAIAGHIGLDATRDIEWVTEPDFASWPGMLEAGEIDVVSAFPPQSYALREAGVGHVILNTTVDVPWRHYFCCMVAGSREFVRERPVAAQRAIRAFLKANRFCSRQPELAARMLVERGATDRREYARRVLRELSYGAWRSYDPRDTLRFFALRLREAGLVKATPSDIIARGSDFGPLEAVRRQLKV